eukprot:3526481-Ditylum_brightwellii.AAC.1
MQQGKCLIAIDGSAGNCIMSFAWKVVDVDGNAYYCHTGPAFGKESLFRVEINTTVYLDNEGMMDRIEKQQIYPFDYSFHTIDPDWVVIAKICNILELMNINADFKHMKGHQDHDTYYEELNLPTHLNIDVDCLKASLPGDTLQNQIQHHAKMFYGLNQELFGLPWFIG